MGQKVARTGIRRKPDRMYFIKGTTVYSVARGRKGAPHKKEVSFRHERDNEYIYFLDGDGDVARAKRKLGGRRKKKKSTKRRSSGRKATKRTATKRKTTKRKVAKRRASTTTTTTRKAPKRKAPKRKVAKKAASKKSDPKKKALKKVMKELKAMGRGLKK